MNKYLDRKIKRRIKELDNPNRYVVYTCIKFSNKLKFYYNAIENVYSMTLSNATQFKDKLVALSIAAALCKRYEKKRRKLDRRMHHSFSAPISCYKVACVVTKSGKIRVKAWNVSDKSC